LLEYTQWRNFLNAVNKATESCKPNIEEVSDHFFDVNEMVKIGLGAEQNREDIIPNTLPILDNNKCQNCSKRI
jgi:DNA-damage-inducible protein D